MIVADKIAEWLHEKGITTAFGIVGGGNVTLWDAITRLGKTQIVSTHHEQAAVMAASAYYQVSRRVSVALVTTGAGSTNAITGVVAAYMDSIPLLVISGNEASKYMDAQTRVWGVQGYGSSEMVSGNGENWNGVVKSGVCVTNPTIVIGALGYSLQDALTPRMGPCWCDIPKDVQNAAV